MLYLLIFSINIDLFSVIINTIKLPAESVKRSNLTGKVGAVSGWGLTADGIF